MRKEDLALIRRNFGTAVCKKQHRVDSCLRIYDETFQKVEIFNYLESILSSDGRNVAERKRRIAIAKELLNECQRY